MGSSGWSSTASSIGPSADLAFAQRALELTKLAGTTSIASKARSRLDFMAFSFLETEGTFARSADRSPTGSLERGTESLTQPLSRTQFQLLPRRGGRYCTRRDAPGKNSERADPSYAKTRLDLDVDE